MTTERAYAAASLSPTGVLVSGGMDNTLTRLSTTEVLTPEGWIVGPSLPIAVAGHCQVTVGSTVILAGNNNHNNLMQRVCHSCMLSYY